MQTEGGQDWDALERTDAAMVAARRAMTNGSDPRQAIRDLLVAATDLASAYGVAGSVQKHAAVDSPNRPVVTKNVTEDHGVNAKDERDVKSDEAAEPPQARQRPRPIGSNESVDLDTVRLERSSDFEQTGQWTVLCDSGEHSCLLGYLAPDGIKGKKWHALGPMLTRVSSLPCRTRKEALLRLLDSQIRAH